MPEERHTNGQTMFAPTGTFLIIESPCQLKLTSQHKAHPSGAFSKGNMVSGDKVPLEKGDARQGRGIIPPALRATSAQGTPYGRLFKGGMIRHPAPIFPQFPPIPSKNG